jgi:hypothetical protein
MDGNPSEAILKRETAARMDIRIFLTQPRRNISRHRESCFKNLKASSASVEGVDILIVIGCGMQELVEANCDGATKSGILQLEAGLVHCAFQIRRLLCASTRNVIGFLCYDTSLHRKFQGTGRRSGPTRATVHLTIAFLRQRGEVRDAVKTHSGKNK